MTEEQARTRDAVVHFAPCYVCTDAAPDRGGACKVTKHLNSRCILCGTIDPIEAVSQAWDRGEPVWVVECPLGTRLQSGPFETRAEAVSVAEVRGPEAVAVRLIKGERDFLEIPRYVKDKAPRTLGAEPLHLIDGVVHHRVLEHGFHRTVDRDDTYEGPFPGLSYEVTVPKGSVDGVLDLLRLAPPGEHVVEDIAETVALWRSTPSKDGMV